MITVFISHSARDALASKVRDQLFERLENETRDGKRLFHPLLDKKLIDLGEVWRPKLFRWLGECQAAVILLSEHALRSRWVQTEATILMWRRQRTPGLTIIPVYVGKPLEALPTRELEPVRITEIQGHCVLCENEIESVLSMIVAKLMQHLVATADDALINWLQSLFRCFRDIPDGVLRRVATEIGIPSEEQSERDDLILTMAHTILQTSFLDNWDQIRTLAAEIIEPIVRERFFHLIIPTWVPREAAASVLRVASGNEKWRNMAVNTELTDIGKDYIYRAVCCRDQKIRIIDTTVLETESTWDAADKAAVETSPQCLNEEQIWKEFEDYDIALLSSMGIRNIAAEPDKRRRSVERNIKDEIDRYKMLIFMLSWRPIFTVREDRPERITSSAVREVPDQRDGSIYLPTDRILLAIDIALATGRPLPPRAPSRAALSLLD